MDIDKDTQKKNQAAVDKLTTKTPKELDYLVLETFLMDYKKRVEAEWEAIDKAPRFILEDIKIDTVMFSEGAKEEEIELLREVAESVVIHEGEKPRIRVMPNAAQEANLKGFTITNTNLIPTLLEGNIGKGITSIELVNAELKTIKETIGTMNLHLGAMNTSVLGNEVRCEVSKLYSSGGYDNLDEEALLSDLVDVSSIVGWELGYKLDVDSYYLTLETDPILSNSLMQADSFHAEDLFRAQRIAELAREDILRHLVTEVLGFDFHDMLIINSNHISYDLDSRTLRNEAVAAAEGDIVLIQSKEDEGIVFAIGKGNKDWNESSPSDLTNTGFSSKLLGETVDILSTIKTIYNSKGEVCND